MQEQVQNSIITATSKRRKFVLLAQNRTKNAIKAIRVIAKLANKAAYEYDDSEVKQIVNALSSEVEALKDRMSSTPSKETIEFTLK